MSLICSCQPAACTYKLSIGAWTRKNFQGQLVAAANEYARIQSRKKSGGYTFLKVRLNATGKKWYQRVAEQEFKTIPIPLHTFSALINVDINCEFKHVLSQASPTLKSLARGEFCSVAVCPRATNKPRLFSFKLNLIFDRNFKSPESVSMEFPSHWTLQS